MKIEEYKALNKPKRKRAHHEHDEQAVFVEWAELHEKSIPQLRALYAIPNAGKRSYNQGKYFKAEGLTKGIPDLHLAVPSCGFASLYLEFKWDKNDQSDDQKEMAEVLAEYNNLVYPVYSFEEAKFIVMMYIRGWLKTEEIQAYKKRFPRKEFNNGMCKFKSLEFSE